MNGCSRASAKKTKNLKAPPGSSATEKIGDPADLCCDHLDRKNFDGQNIPGYFTQSYYDKHPYCTQKCSGSGCDVIFGEKTKISFKNQVFCCTNQNKSGCTVAYCMACIKKIDIKETSRTRRS